MPRRKKSSEPQVKENIVKIEFGDNVQRNMGQYAEAVNLDRAIIDARDGLKPVQRRIVYMAYLDKLFPTNKFTKVAKLGGDVMGNYHPHGDSSVTQAIVNLAQDWKQRYPLIEIQGNKGDISGNRAAAPRYIEARLSKAAMYLMDKYQKSVPMIDNYDNTKKEPKYLPSAIPNALINPSDGIGYGLATQILPHNPIELLRGAIALLKDPELSDEDLLKIIPGPDFPTKGTLVGSHDSGMSEIKEGHGSFVVRGHMKVEEDGKQTLLVADEVPYGTNSTKIVEQFGRIAKDNPALGVVGVADESMNGQLRLVLRFKNDAHVDEAEQLLWRYSDMETRMSSNNTMIINGRPRQVGTREFLEYWLGFRKGILKQELEYDLSITERKLNIIKGLIIVTDDTDKIIKIAKASNGRKGFIEDLVKYGLNQEQAEAIAGLALYRLNKQDRAELLANQQKIDDKIGEIKGNLNDLPSYLHQTLDESIEDLQSDDTINTDRITRLVDKVERKKVNLNKLAAQAVEGKPVFVAARADATAHRMSPRVYQNNIDQAKEERPIIKVLEATTTDWAMFLTDSGRVVTRLVNDLEDINPKYDVESFYRQITDLKTDERFIDLELLNDDVRKENPYILSLTQMGLGKLSELQRSFPNTNTRRYLNNLTVYNGLKNEGDLVGIATLVTADDVKNKKIVVSDKDSDKVLFEHDLSDISIQGQGGSGGRKVPGFEGDKVKFEIIDK